VELFGDISLGTGYISRPQRARKISESWIAANGYCLNCESNRLVPTATNTRSRDFFCDKCAHPYELKSKCGMFSTRILDGAYDAMLRTIREGKTPTFLLLEYSASWRIDGLTAIHHSLITETSIQRRKPLASSARRAGWVGCNIVIPAIAVEGRIPILRDGIMQPRSHRGMLLQDSKG
jgi:type II restriction enzyme